MLYLLNILTKYLCSKRLIPISLISIGKKWKAQAQAQIIILIRTMSEMYLALFCIRGLPGSPPPPLSLYI